MTTIERISPENTSSLSPVYKEVFSGNPWYEERICSGARLNGEEKCAVQYTSRAVPTDYAWKFDKDKGTGVRGESAGLEKCVACERDLIEFYPDFVNQNDLIKEALSEQGFIGFLLRDSNQQPFGFSWGYKTPQNRTVSVNFPLVRPLLASRGIDQDKTFYWAELGIVDKKQGSGFGLLASAMQLKEAKREGYQSFVVRTKNERVLSILKRIFSGKTAERLFADPEKETPWYGGNFQDANMEEISKILKKSRR